MRIEGLKVFVVKEWKADSAFTSDNGHTMTIPANHKVICQDENGDVVNVSFVTPAPLNFKVGQELKGVSLIGNVSRNSFGYTLKAKLV